MYIDNIKKLHDDLKKIIFVKDEIGAADADGEGYNLHTLISIIDKYLHSNIWSMDSFEFMNEFGDWEDKNVEEEMIFWPYAKNLVGMKRRLTLDRNKLSRIYRKIKEEVKI